MKPFRIISLLLAAALFLTGSVFASSLDLPSAQVSYTCSAESYCLMDADTGELLSSRNPDLPMPMASTTKIMTCLVALENGVINDTVTIDQESVGVEGSSVYLVQGETLTLSDLLYALMLESANDAAVAIAKHIAGSVEDFAEQMNSLAQAIGMNQSHFVNPHGLQAEGHHSTARDLCLLMRYAMNNTAFAEIVATRTKIIPAPEGKNRFLSNHNKLLRLYDDCVGGKTGFTKTAGRCLVTAARRDGKRLICATLGAPDDWNDHSSLFDFGFALYETVSFPKEGSISLSIPVVSGMESEVKVSNQDLFSFSVRAQDRVETVIEAPKFMYAPVSEGDVVGQAVFLLNGKEIGRVDLFAENSVNQTEAKLGFWQKIWKTIVSWFR